jgi:molybdopterin molybdotransferase
MISEEEACRQILNGVTTLPARCVPLSEALNGFAAEDYFARSPLPNFDNSAMDGYAVIAADCGPGKRLKIIGEQPAGRDRGLKMNSNQAIRIFTGAPIPAGADAVVMQEDVTPEGSEIVINTEVETGEFVRRQGCDLAVGQKILGKGERLRAVSIATLAAQGFAEVAIGGEVSAAVLSTGDELITPGQKLGPGQIYDSNSVLLEGLLRGCGADVRLVEHCPDREDALVAALKRASQNAVLLISGGVSVGQHDLVKSALKAIGAEINLWRVAIKPGKPFLFGRFKGTSPSPQSSPPGRGGPISAPHHGDAVGTNDCFVFGLPGNPVSSFVTFLKFVRPAILRMMGAADQELALRTVTARLTQDEAGDAQRPHYIRGNLANGEFCPVGRQESHALFGLSRSNALLRLAPGTKVHAGDNVQVEIWE